MNVQEMLYDVGLFAYLLGLLGGLWGLVKTVVGPHLWPLIRDKFVTAYAVRWSDDFGGTKTYRWLSENIKTRRGIAYDGHWVPGAGWYTFKHSGVHFLLKVGSKSRPDGQSDSYFAVFYTHKSRAWFEDWLKQLAKARHEPSLKTTSVSIHVMTSLGSLYLGCKLARTPQSLVFENDLHVKIAEDTARFILDEQYYVDRGIPWTLGYLLHGPPGTGKSSIPFFLAGQLNRDLLIIPAKLLKLPNFSQVFLKAWEQGMICLFDDIDGILGCRPGQMSRSSQEVLHELLGLLDSPLSPHGFIFFMTTNFPEILDDAMIRPGRIDRKYYIGVPKPPEVKRLFEFFYPEADGDVFLAKYGDRKSSPAAITAFFSRYRKADAALESLSDLDEMSSKPKPSFVAPEIEEKTDRIFSNTAEALMTAFTKAAAAGEDLELTAETLAAKFQLDDGAKERLKDVVKLPHFKSELADRANGNASPQIFGDFLANNILRVVGSSNKLRARLALKESSDEAWDEKEDVELKSPSTFEDDDVLDSTFEDDDVLDSL